ncbi:accessory Sec system protein Asp3 [Pediococcus acidilactici]|uniref:accessory Sec system protein Asp3 n=1 Tax=Pediococcus acidilactici TaxID=1254 RepID=UPI001F07594A|nr:accessory Sec system protein Asp3 [Pediococcus acidilactici]
MKSSYFVIRWPVHMNDTYSYGSVINYQNGKIYFKNERMSPGERIHTWKSQVVFDKLDTGYSQLPLLKRKAKYQIITKAIIAPENSVQIQLDFFDVKNEIIDGPLTIDLDGEFEVPEEMDHYQLSLVNLNNRSLEFEDLIIRPVESTFEIATIDGNMNVICLWDRRDHFFEKVEVYLRRRLLYSGSYLGKQNVLRIFVEYDSRANWQKGQLHDAITHATKSLEKVVKERKLAFDALSPDTILLSEPEESLIKLENYTTMELAKILHFYRR